jgi:hypothetical protein
MNKHSSAECFMPMMNKHSSAECFMPVVDEQAQQCGMLQQHYDTFNDVALI